MKVNLVVAQGVHAGKVIPIGTARFLIGRDEQCNLRPASPAISKMHCGIHISGDKVVVKDYGSTNGTFVNGEQVVGEREVSDGDLMKAGPLEFTLKFEASVARPTVKATIKPIAMPVAVAATKIASPPIDEPDEETPDRSIFSDDDEEAAAMLMSMDDGVNTPTAEANIPDGATVTDMPIPGAASPPGSKPTSKPAIVDSSKSAADLLSKYMRRPRE